jgi:hypothetical protein
MSGRGNPTELSEMTEIFYICAVEHDAKEFYPGFKSLNFTSHLKPSVTSFARLFLPFPSDSDFLGYLILPLFANKCLLHYGMKFT